MRTLTIYLVTSLATFGIGLGAASFDNAASRSRLDRETALRHRLYEMRKATDRYATDRGRLPPSLRALVAAGYLKAVPADPMTGRADWAPVMRNGRATPTTGRGVVDVRSSSAGRALDGSLYNEF